MTALSFRSGATRTEGYRYRPFGETTVLDGGGADITASTAGAGNEGNAYRFQGRRFDHEEGSGLYYFRTRFLDPAIGRFISKDSIGDWGDPGNVGNGMTFCGNDPMNCVDPTGTKVRMSAGNAAAMGNLFGAGNITTTPAGNGQVAISFSNAQGAAKFSYDFVKRTQGDMSFRLRLWKAIHTSTITSLAEVQRGGASCPQSTTTARSSTDNRGLTAVRSGYGIRYVRNSCEFYKEEARTWGHQVDPELPAKVLEGMASEMATQIALGVLLEGFGFILGRLAQVGRVAVNPTTAETVAQATRVEGQSLVTAGEGFSYMTGRIGETASGAIRVGETGTMPMFVQPGLRGQGIGSQIGRTHLAHWQGVANETGRVVIVEATPVSEAGLRRAAAAGFETSGLNRVAKLTLSPGG